MNDFFVYDEPRRDVDVNVENAVHREERLRNGNALVRRIVQRAFEPLRARGESGIQRIGDDVTRQRAHPFAAHGVALIRHCGRADLILFKGFFHFLEGLQNPQIVCEFIRALRDTAEHGKEISVHFAGIRLSRNGNAAGKSHIFGDQAFQLFDLFFVAVEKFHKARLRARRPLAAEEQKFVKTVFEFLDVHGKFVRPQRGALSHRGELRGL